MTTDGPHSSTFVASTLVRTAELGGAMALFFAVVVSIDFGVAVALGAVVGAGNFAAITAVGRRMFDGIADDDAEQSSASWTSLLAGKMLLVLIVATTLILVFGIDPIGFAIGFTLFIVSLTWAAVSTAPDTGSP